MQDSENNKPDANESPAPSTEPTLNNPFIPKLGLKELRATWEMLVKFGKAIEENDHWSGSEAEAVAMGLMMIRQMAAQYHVQVDVAERQQKEQGEKLKAQIKAQGGKINGTVNPDPAPLSVA